MAAKDQNNADFQRDLALSLNRLGILSREMDNQKLAYDYFLKSHEIRKQLAIRSPGDHDALKDLSVGLDELGGLSIQLGYKEKAYDYLFISAKLHEKIANLEKDNLEEKIKLASALDRFGSYLLSIEQPKQALMAFFKCDDILSEIVDSTDHKSIFFIAAAKNFTQIALTYQKLGLTNKAISAYQTALAMISAVQQHVQKLGDNSINKQMTSMIQHINEEIEKLSVNK